MKKLGCARGDKLVNDNGKDFSDFQDLSKPDVLVSNQSYYTVLRDGQEVRIDVPGNFIENL